MKSWDISIPESARCVPILLAWQTAVHANHLHAVAGLTAVDKVIVHDNINRAWKLTSRCFLRHFLENHTICFKRPRVNTELDSAVFYCVVEVLFEQTLKN